MTRIPPTTALADDEGNLRPEVAAMLGQAAESAPRRPQDAVARHSSARVAVASLAIIGIVSLGGHLIPRVRERFALQVPGKVTAQVIATNVLLRAEPGTGGTALGILQPEDQVEVLSLQDGWARVRAEEDEGWIYGGLLRGVGHGCLGAAAIVKPLQVATERGQVMLYRDMKLLVERDSASGNVVAVLPDGRRVSVPRARLVFFGSEP